MLQRSLYTPIVLYPSKPNDARQITHFQHEQHVHVVDAMREYCRELYAIRHPESIYSGITPKQVIEFTDDLLPEKTTIDEWGVWVWYTWSRTLIHFLPEDLHTELRTARNRNLITIEEQTKFYQSHIGVAGLSVGNSVVASLLHTGGAKYLRIADHDNVSGSNINRIRCGFDVVDVPKYAISAREVYGVNPYAKLQVYPGGITLKNIEKFLTYPKPLDVVIDEMDSLYLKIQLRVMARKHRIPVIMAADNGDGIVVDIERYDRDPTLPLMHGQVSEKELLQIASDTPRIVAAKIISRWVQPQNISDRMKSSLLEIGKSLYTWPQLGNAAFMAGSVLSYVARKIILGEPIVEGKIIINPDAFFVPGYHGPEKLENRNQQTSHFIKIMGL